MPNDPMLDERGLVGMEVSYVSGPKEEKVPTVNGYAWTKVFVEIKAERDGSV